MSNNETCIHGGNTPVNLLSHLHHSQGGTGRHKCPVCAYEEGFNLGSSGQWESYQVFSSSNTDSERCLEGSIAPTAILTNLGDNQGGTGRHKCTNCAFKAGFIAGLASCITSHHQVILDQVDAPPHAVPHRHDNRQQQGRHVNFVQREIANKNLGLRGEEFVLAHERNRLAQAGRHDLADRVEHVSVTQGDGLGYDILSFDPQGHARRIEVKTTRSDITRPFYVSKNELEVSGQDSATYTLYRLFDFNQESNHCRFYIINGNLNDLCDLIPVFYLASPI